MVGSVAGPRAKVGLYAPLEGMENVYLLNIEGIMGGEGPARGWSVMRPSIRMGQNLSGYLTGP